MHVMCVMYKVAEVIEMKTYLCFIGRSSQGAGSVLAIYETCLKQVKEDLPQIKFLIDKSDNAGCYRTEISWSWKAHWPPKNTGHVFKETMTNERQAGKIFVLIIFIN